MDKSEKISQAFDCLRNAAFENFGGVPVSFSPVQLPLRGDSSSCLYESFSADWDLSSWETRGGPCDGDMPLFESHNFYDRRENQEESQTRRWWYVLEHPTFDCGLSYRSSYWRVPFTMLMNARTENILMAYPRGQSNPMATMSRSRVQSEYSTQTWNGEQTTLEQWIIPLPTECMSFSHTTRHALMSLHVGVRIGWNIIRTGGPCYQRSGNVMADMVCATRDEWSWSESLELRNMLPMTEGCEPQPWWWRR